MSGLGPYKMIMEAYVKELMKMEEEKGAEVCYEGDGLGKGKGGNPRGTYIGKPLWILHRPNMACLNEFALALTDPFFSKIKLAKRRTRERSNEDAKSGWMRGKPRVVGEALGLAGRTREGENRETQAKNWNIIWRKVTVQTNLNAQGAHHLALKGFVFVADLLPSMRGC
ncbi:hypothetical protein HPP92_013458 [Vanilla planifolia]|uniref:Uncharacterized protein n=1 Tax=Vanilla planifolia TaxID=51239 RepID=A0A835UWH4_VANPL|nr:hypothetical protein HPP92_013458 [Vanilla planifolia]